MVSQKRNELEAVIRKLADEAKRDPDSHATLQELIAYHGGQVSAEEEKRIQDHLVACRECTALLLDLESFTDVDQRGAPRPSDEEIAASWQAIESQIQEAERPVVAASPGQRRSRSVFFSTPVLYAMAASLLFASLGLGIWALTLWQENQHLAALNRQLAGRDQDVASMRKSLEEAERQLEEMTRRSGQSETQIAELRQTVDELSQPQLNAPIIDLLPRNFIRGQEGAVKTIEASSGTNFFSLILNVSGQPSQSEYALEIVDRRGRIVWRGRGLRKSEFNNFTLTLTRRLFPAGQYRINLYGLRDGRRELVEDYAVRIRYQ